MQPTDSSAPAVRVLAIALADALDDPAALVSPTLTALPAETVAALRRAGYSVVPTFWLADVLAQLDPAAPVALAREAAGPPGTRVLVTLTGHDIGQVAAAATARMAQIAERGHPLVPGASFAYCAFAVRSPHATDPDGEVAG